MSEKLLPVDNLNVTFDTRRGAVRAVRNLSFSLAKGQTLGIVGESGSGKSVLIKNIIGLMEATPNIKAMIEASISAYDFFKLDSDTKKKEEKL